jgi:hypothetical protein
LNIKERVSYRCLQKWVVILTRSRQGVGGGIDEKWKRGRDGVWDGSMEESREGGREGGRELGREGSAGNEAGRRRRQSTV